MYLFITGTKVLSFATRLLQQEARPQGDLEQITVVYSIKKKTRFPTRKQQQELHKPATILLRTSGNLTRAFGLQKEFIHSSILCSFTILYFILQNRFHPSYVIFLNFRLSTNHPPILSSPASFLHPLLSVPSSTAPCYHYRYWFFTNHCLL
jgi:hypothetical protein